MAPGATWTLPAVRRAPAPTLYFQRQYFDSRWEVVPRASVVEVQGNHDSTLVNGDAEAELLVLQGRPIGEPVAQYGPFVMNAGRDSPGFADYRRTEFGGWPWGASDPVHPRDKGRFARHADGTLEER